MTARNPQSSSELGGSLLLAHPSLRDDNFKHSVILIASHDSEGAMGVVYLGKDPKIGRVVAIKTMALSQEFAGDELVDARERFIREAQFNAAIDHDHR